MYGCRLLWAFLDNIGWRAQKRWGVLFMGMVTHAIYSVVWYHLTQDLFSHAYWRFLAVQGQNTMEIFSENGTTGSLVTT